jgi:hypothetical protein
METIRNLAMMVNKHMHHGADDCVDWDTEILALAKLFQDIGLQELCEAADVRGRKGEHERLRRALARLNDAVAES